MEAWNTGTRLVLPGEDMPRKRTALSRKGVTQPQGSILAKLAKIIADYASYFAKMGNTGVGQSLTKRVGATAATLLAGWFDTG